MTEGVVFFWLVLTEGVAILEESIFTATPLQIEKTVIILMHLLPVMLQNCQKETKLFEFSQNTNR